MNCSRRRPDHIDFLGVGAIFNNGAAAIWEAVDNTGGRIRFPELRHRDCVMLLSRCSSFDGSFTPAWNESITTALYVLGQRDWTRDGMQDLAHRMNSGGLVAGGDGEALLKAASRCLSIVTLPGMLDQVHAALWGEFGRNVEKLLGTTLNEN